MEKASRDYRDEVQSQEIPAKVDADFDDGESEKPEITLDEDEDISYPGDDPDIVREPTLPSGTEEEPPSPDQDTERDTPHEAPTQEVPADTSGIGDEIVSGNLDKTLGYKKGAYRFVFHSSPTLEFNPPESGDGKTSVVISRAGEIRIWAEVHNLSDPDAPKEETPQYVYSVKPPSFALSCTPEKTGNWYRSTRTNPGTARPCRRPGELYLDFSCLAHELQRRRR